MRTNLLTRKNCGKKISHEQKELEIKKDEKKKKKKKN